MWQTLSRPWQVCVEQAWGAYCTGSAPIGACITGRDGQILAWGRNRLLDNLPGDHRHISQTPLAHAEVNALLAFDHTEIDAHTCTLYSAVEPCPLCVGALTMANIRTVCLAARDVWAGATDLLAGIAISAARISASLAHSVLTWRQWLSPCKQTHTCAGQE